MKVNYDNNSMRISIEEKRTIDNISTISCIDENTVKKVFESLLTYITLEAYDDSKEIIIPYIGKIKFDYIPVQQNSKLTYQLELELESGSIFEAELIKVKNGNMTSAENNIRQRISGTLTDIIKGKD